VDRIVRLDLIFGTLRRWSSHRWAVAALAAAGFAVLISVPTDLIDTPLFSREIPPTWWSWPAVLISAVLAGMVVASYVRSPDQTPTRSGWVGGFLTFFAVGCPVCNKLVLLAVGSAGALQWFEPVQPVLQVLAVGLLGWAFVRRLTAEAACTVVT
jgi:hypothetical protein